MLCPNCQFENPGPAAFCMNCGKKLPKVCTNCSASLPDAARFCMNCGQPVSETSQAEQARLASLAAATPAPLAEKMRLAHLAGERKLVTALFVDVVGSTTMAEQMDPEEWTLIMNGAFQALSPAIHRYEGTIARLMGDALLAFFGAPVAHEDDAVRAIRAGLDLLTAAKEIAAQVRQQYGLVFEIRVGCNSGEVVVGEVGSDLKYEYTAMGDAVNLAARMQTLAEPGTLLVTEHTQRLAAPFFEFEDRGLVTVKGRSEPVRALRVLAARQGAIQARGIAGLDSPLVGRESEMESLAQAVHRARQGQGGIAALIAEAGLGKSRLVAELRKSISTDSPPMPLWLEGRSLSYQTGVPYAPFVDLLTRYFDLQEGLSDAEKYGSILARLEALLGDDAAMAAPYLASLLGIPPDEPGSELLRYLDPPILMMRVSEAVGRLFTRLAARQPLVLVFEDLHWVDPTSLTLLNGLLPLVRQSALLVLAIFRPRQDELSWGLHTAASQDYADCYTAVTLHPLDDSQARQLVTNLLHVEDLPPSLRSLILEKAEGNPFYVEEVIRSLLDAHLIVRQNNHWQAVKAIETIRIPDTLVGVIAARLDRLDDQAKHVAQAAAVLGREFRQDLLARVYPEPLKIEAALSLLQQREIVRRTGDPSEATYAFKHVLTQETAYASLLISQRRLLHRKAAESLIQGELANPAEIARHYLEAQMPSQALPYLVSAAGRAARAYANREAADLYQRALQILPAEGEAALVRQVYEGLGGVRMLSGDLPAALQNYHEMLEYAVRAADLPMQASAHNKLAMTQVWLGDMPSAESNLLQAEAAARQASDAAGLSEMFTLRCQVCNMAGDFTRATFYLGESIDLGRLNDIKEQIAFGQVHMANTLTSMTRFDEAWKVINEVRPLLAELGNLLLEADLDMQAVPFYHWRSGDYPSALAAASHAARLSARIGSVLTECLAEFALGILTSELGEYQTALAHLERGRAAGLLTGIPFLETYVLGRLGLVYWMISPALADKYLPLHAQALEMLAMPLGMPAAGYAWADIGECLLERGKIDEAAQLFDRGLNENTGDGLLNRPRFYLGRAAAHLAQGEIDLAVPLIGEAHQFAAERGMYNYQAAIDLLDARLAALQGDLKASLQLAAQAEQQARRLGQRPLALQACGLAVELLAQQGDMTAAQAKQQQVQQVVDEMAALFSDPVLGELFMTGQKQSGHDGRG